MNDPLCAPSARPHRAFTLVELLVVIALIGVLVAILLPAVQAAREAANRMSCGNNLKQLALACHTYHDTHQTLPPNGFHDDARSRRPATFAWTIGILPFIEQQPLFDKIDFDYAIGYYADPRTGSVLSPNNPSNGWVVAQPIAAYLCASDGTNEDGVSTSIPRSGPQPVGLTNYKACHGTNYELAPYSTAGTQYEAPASSFASRGNGMFGNPYYHQPKQKFAKVTDGLSNTIMLGESLPAHCFSNAWGDHYTPSNRVGTTAIPLNAKASCQDTGNWEADRVFCRTEHPDRSQGTLGFASRHPGGGQFALGDGSVRYVPQTVDFDVYRSAGTANLGEAVSLP